MNPIISREIAMADESITAGLKPLRPCSTARQDRLDTIGVYLAPLRTINTHA